MIDTYSLRYCVKGYFVRQNYLVLSCANSVYIAFPPKTQHKPLLIKIGFCAETERKKLAEQAKTYGFLPFNIKGKKGIYKTKDMFTGKEEHNAKMLPDINVLISISLKKKGDEANDDSAA